MTMPPNSNQPSEPLAWQPRRKTAAQQPVPGQHPVAGQPVGGQPVAAPQGVPQPVIGPDGVPMQQQGVAAQQPGPQAFTVPQSVPRMDRKKRRAIIGWTVTVLGIGVLLGGAAIAINLINESRDPAEQVEKYLGYLAEGKASKANEMVAPEGADDEGSLLTDEVMEQATERITVNSVETQKRGAKYADVTADVSLAGEDYEVNFKVQRGDKEYLFLDTWELKQGLTTSVELMAYAESQPLASMYQMSLAGVGLSSSGRDAAEDDSVWVEEEVIGADVTATATVYPAVYPVSLSAGEYFSSSKETVVAAPVGAEDANAIQLASVEPTEALQTAIMEQANQYAEGCVSVTGNSVVRSNMDSACPWATQRRDLASLKVVEYPDGFDFLTSYSFTTDEYVFETLGNSKWSTPSDSSSALSGEITWKDGEPVVSDAEF